MVTLSVEESKKLGVLLARGDRLPALDVDLLRKAIYEGAFDFCRIKVPSSDEQTIEKLRELNMPWFIHTILVRNSIDLNNEKLDDRELRLGFELYDANKAELLGSIVKRAWGARTAVNYTDPVYQGLIGQEKELKAAMVYAQGFDAKLDPAKRCWFIKKGDETIGFVCGSIDEDSFEGVMYSIVPEHRGDRLAADVMLFLKRMCVAEDLSFFCNDVPYQNMPSLKSIVRESIGPVGTYLNITINSLLSTSIGPADKHILTKVTTKQQLAQTISERMDAFIGGGYIIKDRRFDLGWVKLNEHTEIELTIPFRTQRNAQLVCKVIHNKIIVGSAYGWYVGL